MRARLAALLLAVSLLVVACGTDSPTQRRTTTAPPLKVEKISEVLYDNTVYYGHYRFHDRTGTYECFVGDNSASSNNAKAQAGGFTMSCLPPPSPTTGAQP